MIAVFNILHIQLPVIGIRGIAAENTERFMQHPLNPAANLWAQIVLDLGAASEKLLNSSPENSVIRMRRSPCSSLQKLDAIPPSPLIPFSKATFVKLPSSDHKTRHDKRRKISGQSQNVPDTKELHGEHIDLLIARRTPSRLRTTMMEISPIALTR